MPTSQRSGIRTIITLLLIAGLAAVVWKLYVVDDAPQPTNTTTTTNTATNTATNAATNTPATAANTNTTTATSTRTKTESIEKNGFFAADLPQPTVSDDGQEAFLYTETDAISALDPDLESIIRGSYGVTAEKEITIDGVKGKRLTGSSPKDGSVVEYILITNGDKLIFARGTATFLDRLIDTLELD